MAGQDADALIWDPCGDACEEQAVSFLCRCHRSPPSPICISLLFVWLGGKMPSIVSINPSMGARFVGRTAEHLLCPAASSELSSSLASWL